MTQLGRAHTISLPDLALLYAYDLRRVRLSTDTESEKIIEDFHRMGCCSRCLYDTELWCRFSRHTSRFPLCRTIIGSVEAVHGGSMANYFRSFRWFLLLNLALSIILFVFILLPAIYDGPKSIDARALLLGDGAANSVFFYGGYVSIYDFGWHMDTGWVLILAAILFFSLFFIVFSFDSEAIAQTEDSSISSEHPFTAVLGSINYNERDPARLNQVRRWQITAEISAKLTFFNGKVHLYRVFFIIHFDVICFYSPKLTSMLSILIWLTFPTGDPRAGDAAGHPWHDAPVGCADARERAHAALLHGPLRPLVRVVSHLHVLDRRRHRARVVCRRLARPCRRENRAIRGRRGPAAVAVRVRAVPACRRAAQVHNAALHPLLRRP